MSGIDREAIAEMFSAFGPVVVKSMFGGAGIYADGVFFALVDDGVIYLKADDDTRPRFEAEGCAQFVYEGKTREVAMSYWRMPERLYDDPEELAQWAKAALDAANRAAAKKGRGKSGKVAGTSVRRRSPSSGGTRNRVRR
jgi:DNA transformation protein